MCGARDTEVGFSVGCITEALVRWVVLAATHCEGTLRSLRRGRCAVAAGSIHHNLTFNWRERGGGSRVREKEMVTEEERKRDKAVGMEREGQGVYLHLGDGFTVE